MDGEFSMKIKSGTGIRMAALLLAAVMLCGCGGEEEGSNDGKQEDRNTTESVDDPVSSVPEETPEPPKPVVFEAQDMEGNTVSSDIFTESKLTMVNVWATYCNPCLSEMPELGELAGEYDPGEFRLIGIISDVVEGAAQEELDNAAELIEQTGADYSHLLLNQSLYNGMLSNVTAVPTTFFVDENGIILGRVVGARNKSAWKEIIDELLEEL